MKTDRIVIRVDPKERAEWGRARGLVPLATWLRDLANRAAKRAAKKGGRR